ncbi:hypothetical protein L1887_18464 [Cichorium endivia]|nr:hypothetical protein L1887_18464 [Cichorium endivia]
MSFSTSNLEKYRIPLDEILRVTENFSSETLIGDGGFGMVHKGQLSEEWQKRTVAIKRLNRNGTRFYMDPLYAERSRLTKESDVYSFGVVMFEISSGALVYQEKCFGDADKPQFLLDVVRSCYDDEKNGARPDKLIDPILGDHINIKSFHTFNKIAHECVSLKLEQRPPMAKIIRKIEQALNIELKHEESPSTSTTRSLNSFLIPLDEINLATQNFDKKTRIGDYKYGAVHTGQLSGQWQNRTMAITRLSPESYQKEQEFQKELQMISKDQFDIFQEYYRNNELDQFIDHSIRDQIESRGLNILKETAYRCIKRSYQRHIMRNTQEREWERGRGRDLERGRGRGRGLGPKRGAYVASGRDKRPSITMDEVVERIEDAVDFAGYEN